MGVLWCGGEDIDFPNGTGTMNTNGVGGRFRPAWSRGQVSNTNATLGLRSNVFPGGAITSAWLRFVANVSGGAIGASKVIGFGLSGGEKGFGIGSATASGTRIALFKYDGTTRTELAAESGNSIPSGIGTPIFDVQVINFGVSATVNVYFNGVLVITFTGDLTVSGMVSNFDCVVLFGSSSGGAQLLYLSEIVVSTDDTRSLNGLLTLALTGPGDTNLWDNTTFSNINPLAFSDTNPTSTNTVAEDNEYNVTDGPNGKFSILAVKHSIRTVKSSVPVATQVKLGYKSGGTIGFGAGATQSPLTTYSTLEQLDTQNPVTSALWQQADLNALQLDWQSA